MRHFCYFVCLCLLSLSATQAQAQSAQGSGFYFEETLLPVFKNENSTRSASVGGDNSAAAESGFGYDSRTTLGLVLGRGFLVGATYNMYQLATKRDATTANESNDETVKSSEYGPTLGWLGSNWRFLFTYFTSGNRSDDEKHADATGAVTGDQSISNNEMMGYQVLVGYSFMITNRLGLGPSLLYRSVSYAKQSKVNRASITPGAEDYDDLVLSDKFVRTTLDAMLSLTYRF